MKKTFKILVAGTLTMFCGMATVAQGQLPTDRYGTPIYGNQEPYYGAVPLPAGCLSGNCGDHAVGPLVGSGYAGVPSGPCFAGPCLPCFPCVGGGGVLNRIWNGQNYWQGTGCSERVIDELRKSWQHCPQCDLMGENINGRSGNTIGTGLRSAQLVNMGAPYGPIKMNAGQPEKGYYSAPTRASSISTPGGCKSCRQGITVTTNSPQNPVPAQNIVPVQYTEPVQKPRRKTGSFHYRTNYAPAVETRKSDKPGYIRAMENATRNGLGFGSVSEKSQESAWRATLVSGNHNVQTLPATSGMETVATPAPRSAGTSVLSGTPGMETQVAYPSVVAPAYPVEACGSVCEPCAPDCGPVCAPCFTAPCFGGEWPGLIPIAAQTVKAAGIAAYRTGRAAVIGTGMVARGAVRTVGVVLWNRPLPEPFWGPCAPFCDPCSSVCAPCGADSLYAENDFYLNADYRANAPTGMVANNTYAVNNGYLASNSVSASVSNLYEDGYYPQNYNYLPTSVIPQTSVATAKTVPLKPATGTATLLSYEPQRVYTEDGTEVIIEHEAMLPEKRLENRLENAVQYASAKAPATPTHYPVGVAPYQAVSLGAQQDVPLEDVPTAQVAPVQNTKAYPIVAAERPQIQLAPGEVLVSQEDFVLLPATPAPAMQNTVPVQTIPMENVTVPREVPVTVPTQKPIQDMNVTRVSFVQPITPTAVKPEQEKSAVYRMTDSGWQVKATP